MPNDSSLINWGHLTKFASNLKDKFNEIANVKATTDEALISLSSNVSYEKEIVLQYTINKVPKPDGTLYTDWESTVTWYGTDKIPIPTGVRKIKFAGVSFKSTQADITPLAFYDEDNSFVSCVTPKFDFATQYGIVDVPDSAKYFIQSKYYKSGDSHNSENYTYFLYGTPKYDLNELYKLTINEDNKIVTSTDYSNFPNPFVAGNEKFTNGIKITSKTKFTKIFVNEEIENVGIYVSEGAYSANGSWRSKCENVDVVDGVADISLYDVYAFPGDEVYVKFNKGTFKYSASDPTKSYTAINTAGTRTSVNYLVSFNLEYYTNIDMSRSVEYIEKFQNAVNAKIGDTEIYEYTRNFDDFKTKNGYIDSQGRFESDTNWISTERTPVISGTEIEYSLNGYRNIPVVAFYTNTGTFISNGSVVTSDELTVSGKVTVPANAKYVIFVTRSTLVSSAVIKMKKNASVSKSINAINSKIENYVFNKKICCIGDSLTQGVDVGTHLIAESYPYFLEKYLGCRTINFGKMGTTPKTWWNNHKDQFTFDSSIDAVIIMFGTNGGLTTNTLSTDVEAYDDYEDYADTSVGCYCKIIEYIMSETQNKAQIILMTPPHSTYSDSQETTVVNTEAVVRAIAKRYALPVIDVLNECGMNKFNGDIFRPHDGCHFNAKGYHKLGTFVGSKLKSMFSEWDFNDVYDDETDD